MFIPAPTGPLMAGRLLKVSSLATAVCASSGFYVYNRQLGLDDLSVIRFGRATATVSYCTPLPLIWELWIGCTPTVYIVYVFVLMFYVLFDILSVFAPRVLYHEPRLVS